MNILVNATAVRSSGALSILRQFISELSSFRKDDLYYLFISNQLDLPQLAGVTYIKVNKLSWLERILWDEYGFRNWIKKYQILPDLIISFQNTGVNYSVEIPQLIYYHQPLPLVNYKWSFFNKNERIFFLYKKFYSFFVRRYIHLNTHVVVQIPFIKEAFIRKFRFNSDRIYVIKPNIKKLDSYPVKAMLFGDEFIHFIYPATPLLYKNHECLVCALAEIRKFSSDLVKSIRIHFTFSHEKAPLNLIQCIESNGVVDNFIFSDTMGFEKLLSYYKASHALLFPSYIETFGLPLLEAANLGLPVLVTDMAYSRDVIGDYEGSCFLKLNDMQAWAEAIALVSVELKRFKPYVSVQKNGWEEFFYLIDKLKNR